MKLFLGIALATAGLELAACSGTTASNPETTIRSALNPPAGLASLTGDGQMVLTWKAANTEKDFQGYNVYVLASTVANLGTPAYPANASIDPVASGTDSIPYCADNSAIFEKFGLPKTTTACTGANAAGVDTSSTSLVDKHSQNLLDSTTASATAGFITCEENTTSGSNVSLPATAPALGTQTCTVQKDSTGTAIKDGTTYAVFVTSVSGSSQGNLSWSSNFVQDTPGTFLFPALTSPGSYKIGTGSLVLAAGDSYLFAASNLTAQTAYSSTSPTTETACSTYSTSGANICKVLNTNQITGADGLYFGLLGSGSYPYRVFLSVPANSSIGILARGPQISFDSSGSPTSPGVAGDHAVADSTTTVYDYGGTLYAIYGDQVFDLKIKNSSGKYNYGKVVISGPPSANTSTGAVTLNVAIIVQSQVGSTDYFGGVASAP